MRLMLPVETQEYRNKLIHCLRFCNFFFEFTYRVIATCRNPDKAKDLIEIAKKFSDELSIEKLDVSKSDQVEALKRKLDKSPIDLLILNAGVSLLSCENLFFPFFCGVRLCQVEVVLVILT